MCKGAADVPGRYSDISSFSAAESQRTCRPSAMAFPGSDAHLAVGVVTLAGLDSEASSERRARKVVEAGRAHKSHKLFRVGSGEWLPPGWRFMVGGSLALCAQTLWWCCSASLVRGVGRPQ